MSSKSPNPTRNKSQRAAASRERLAQLEAAQRSSQRKKLGLGFGLTVVIVVVALIVARVAIGKNTGPAAARTTGGTVVAQVTAVPAGVIDSIGAGSGVTPPTDLAGQPPLTSGGKPRIVYVGAEYCPYCGAERWSVVQALSRFGTFTGLGQTRSAPDDGNVATLSFHGATYSSPYLSFEGIEQTDNSHRPLDATPTDVQKLVQKYDTPTYLPGTPANENPIPFVDLGGKSLIGGASYDYQLLAGLDQSQIAADLTNPKSPVTRAIVGAANAITKRLCTLTGNRPSNVCTAAGVTAAA